MVSLFLLSWIGLYGQHGLPARAESTVQTKPIQTQENLKINTTIKAKEFKPQPKPQAVISVPKLGKEQIIQAIYAKFGVRPQLIVLVNCESGFNTRAFNPKDVNGKWDAGIFQINQVHGQTPEYWFNVQTNINKAWEISKGGTSWGGWPNCAREAGLL